MAKRAHRAVLPITFQATFPDNSPDAAFLQVRGDDCKLVLIIPKSAAVLLTLASDQLKDGTMKVTIERE